MEYANISPDLIRGKVDPMIMKFLSERDMYCDEIFELSKDLSGGTYAIKKPTIYSALSRLEKKGWIRGYLVDNPRGGNRKYYNLTENGKNSLVERKDDWRFSKDVVDILLYGKLGKTKFGDAPDTEELRKVKAALEELDLEAMKRQQQLFEDQQFVENQKRLLQEQIKEETQVITQASAVIQEFLEEKSAEQAQEVDGQVKDTNGNITHLTQYITTNNYHPGYSNGVRNTGATHINHQNNAFSLPLTGANGLTAQSLSPVIQSDAVVQNINPYILGATAVEPEPSAIFEEYKAEEKNEEVIGQSPQVFQSTQIAIEAPEQDKHYPPTDNRLARYVQPGEYVVMPTKTASPVIMPNLLFPEEPVVQSYVPQPTIGVLSSENAFVIDIKPFVRHANIQDRNFILYNRLKAMVSIGVALILIALLAITNALLNNTSVSGVHTIFVFGYVSLVVYLLVNLAVFAVFPRLKRLNAFYNWEWWVRLLIFGSLVIITLGVNFASGLTDQSATSYHIAFLLVPMFVSFAVMLEWAGLYIMRNAQFFKSN